MPRAPLDESGHHSTEAVVSACDISRNAVTGADTASFGARVIVDEHATREPLAGSRAILAVRKVQRKHSVRRFGSVTSAIVVLVQAILLAGVKLLLLVEFTPLGRGELRAGDGEHLALRASDATVLAIVAEAERKFVVVRVVRRDLELREAIHGGHWHGQHGEVGRDGRGVDPAQRVFLEVNLRLEAEAALGVVVQQNLEPVVARSGGRQALVVRLVIHVQEGVVVALVQAVSTREERGERALVRVLVPELGLTLQVVASDRVFRLVDRRHVHRHVNRVARVVAEEHAVDVVPRTATLRLHGRVVPEQLASVVRSLVIELREQGSSASLVGFLEVALERACTRHNVVLIVVLLNRRKLDDELGHGVGDKPRIAQTASVVICATSGNVELRSGGILAVETHSARCHTVHLNGVFRD